MKVVIFDDFQCSITSERKGNYYGCLDQICWFWLGEQLSIDSKLGNLLLVKILDGSAPKLVKFGDFQRSLAPK